MAISKSNSVKRAILIGSGTAVQTAAATVTANLDCMGADYAVINVVISKAVNTSAVGPTLSLLHSDDTTVTNFATIVANSTLTTNTSSAQLIAYEVDMRARKRYLRLQITTATHTTNDTIIAFAQSELWLNSQEVSATTGRGDVVIVP